MLCSLSVVVCANRWKHELAEQWSWVIVLILGRGARAPARSGCDAFADEELAAAFIRVAAVAAAEPFQAELRYRVEGGCGNDFPCSRRALWYWAYALTRVTLLSPEAAKAFVPVASTLKKIRPLLKGTVDPSTGKSDNNRWYEESGDTESCLMERLLEDLNAAEVAKTRLEETVGPEVLEQLESAIEAGKDEAAAENAAWDEVYQREKDKEDEWKRKKEAYEAEEKEREERKAQEAEAERAAKAAAEAAAEEAARPRKDTIFDRSKYVCAG